jgi:hypothetical protein
VLAAICSTAGRRPVPPRSAAAAGSARTRSATSRPGAQNAPNRRTR